MSNIFSYHMHVIYNILNSPWYDKYHIIEVLLLIYEPVDEISNNVAI